MSTRITCKPFPSGGPKLVIRKHYRKKEYAGIRNYGRQDKRLETDVGVHTMYTHYSIAQSSVFVFGGTGFDSGGGVPDSGSGFASATARRICSPISPSDDISFNMCDSKLRSSPELAARSITNRMKPGNCIVQSINLYSYR